jgi:hypothetical protein
MKALPAHILSITALLFVLSGCDRAFQDVGEATIEVVHPDVSTATTEEQVILELSVESVREVTRVRSQATEFARDASTGHWQAPVTLKKGLTQVIIEAFVDDGPTRTDTVSIFRLAYTQSSVAVSMLPFTTGSHSLTRTPSGPYLLVGGSYQAGETAALDTHTWSVGDAIFKPMRALPTFPRVGHTASALPDGRVLIVGGAVRGNVEVTTDLVSTVEVFDPATQEFNILPFSGDPIRRMYHTAMVRERNGLVFLIVLGGRGDTQYYPNPLLGIREDMRTFQLRNDSLVALSPAVGPFIEPLAGHVGIPMSTGPESSASRFLVNGLKFGPVTTPSSFVMDFDGPFGIDITPTRAMHKPRIRHAGVVIAPGIVALFGGRGEDPEDVLGTGEIYVEEANAYFKLPFTIKPRFGLSATLLPDNNILLLGGFDATSNALTDADFVSLEVQ